MRTQFDSRRRVSLLMPILILGGSLALQAPLAGEERVTAGKAAASPRASREPSGPPLEELLTVDGRRVRGRVVGYDPAKQAYVVESGDGEVRVREVDILTIRQVGQGELLPPKSRQEMASGAQDPPPGAAPGDASPVQTLLDRAATLPPPRSVAAGRAYREALQHLREGRRARAREALEAAVEHEPLATSVELFLAALRLEDGDIAGAYRPLRRVAHRDPTETLALDLLSHAARQLGYRHEARRFAEASLRARFEGAELLYRVFDLRRELRVEPDIVLAAWEDYLAVDPKLERVTSAEGSLLREGIEALSAGTPGDALARFSAAVDANPHLADVVRPHRVRALKARALAHRERGDLELFLADLQALVAEDPLRADDVRSLREEGERALIERRLDAVATVEEARAALADLAAWIPDLKEAHRAAVARSLQRLARREIFHNRVEPALAALGLVRRWSVSPRLDDETREYLEEQLRMSRLENRDAVVRAWIEGIAALDRQLAARWNREFASGAKLPPAGAPGDGTGKGRTRSRAVAGARSESEGKTGTGSQAPAESDAEPSDPETVAATDSHRAAESGLDIESGTETLAEPGEASVAGSERRGPGAGAASGGVTRSRSLSQPKEPAGAASRLASETSGTVDRPAPGSPDPALLAADGPDDPFNVYFPRRVGNRWVYRHSDGTLDLQRLDRVEPHPEFGWIHRFENHFEVGDLKIPYSRSSFVVGNTLRVGPGIDPAEADRWLHVPLSVGTSWSWRNGELAFERTCESLDATVSCAAGEFDGCVKIRATSHFGSASSQAIVQWYYFAPGVGLVKVESENPAEGYELESYAFDPLQPGESPATMPPR